MRLESLRRRNAILAAAFLLLVTASPLTTSTPDSPILESREIQQTSTIEPWTGADQPWPQSGRTPGRDANPPAHSLDGGAGTGSPADATELMTISEPAKNWQYGSYALGTDSFATPIGDFTASIETEDDSIERCGADSLFTILVQTVDQSGTDHSYLRIIEGEDADLAWEVDLGATDKVKAAPMIVDIDDDGKQEIIVVFDLSGTLHVVAYSPRLTCSVTGWSPSGSHATELLWTYMDETLNIGAEGPYDGFPGYHKPTAQPLLADLDLDGSAELVISAIRESTGDPVVLALDLSINSATDIWTKTLEKGTHPSDPTFVQTDENTAYVLLTTIQSSSSSMWFWKLDSDDGDSHWNGKSLENLNGFNSDAPHIRLPGPVLAEVDPSSSGIEAVVTIPTDFDENSAAYGAEYYGIRISDGSKVWDIEASNGYADAAPTVIDTDGDGDHDRVCWITWTQNSLGTNRDGHAGCHEDTDTSNPQEAFSVEILEPQGTPNDGIAVASPAWLDIDGSGEPELLVPYGRELRAYDGELGTMAGVNGNWNNKVDIGHRVWSSPAFGDIDGDATIDLVLGDTVISLARSDVRPLLDGRSIEFDPTAPNPGETVRITAFFENAGTADTDRDTDAILYANDEVIARERAGAMQPVDPSGSGSFASFSVEWSGGLGEHTFRLELDPWSNITQTRSDNDEQIVTLLIVPPYNASFEIPTEPTRVTPGESTVATPTIRSTGRLAGTWSLSIDDSNLPQGWSWSDETPGGLSGVEISVDQTWSPALRIHAPAGALGSDAGHLGMTLTLDSDENVSVTAVLPIEANRTRGLSIRGPDGTASSIGYGLVGEDAKAWMLVHNLGNAVENQITMSWDNTAWGQDLRLFDQDENQVNALILQPDEVVLLTARLSVPNNANLGDSVSTPLEMCVESEVCQTIDLDFIAAGVVMDVHQRSVPDNELTWEIIADMPTGISELEWSLSEAGMTRQGWSWSGSGDLSILSDSIYLTRSGGSRVYGTLHLQLPSDAPPAFDSFSDASDESNQHFMRFSLEVLQVYRADLVVTSPTEQPHEVEVEEDVLIMLRLENPGNGDDTYRLSHKILLDENITEDPGISVSFSSDNVLLGAGSLRTIPVIAILPSTTPAATPVSIEISMISQGDQGIVEKEVVILQARQDHRWEITASYEGENIANRTIFADPGDLFNVQIDAKNIGNLHDDLTITASHTIEYTGSDDSSDWISTWSDGGGLSSVAVNATGSTEVKLGISQSAWNGSKMLVSLEMSARGEYIETIEFTVEASNVQAWTATADQANLEIEPEGSTIEMTITQLGNAPSRAYSTVYVNGSTGWLVEAPEELPILNPRESAPLLLDITPPSDAQHGRTVELHLRLREGNSLSEIIVPLRVAVIHDFTLEGASPWVVSSQGGFPHASLSNLGNAPTTITLTVKSMPSGWTVSGQTKVVLGVQELTGVPLEIIPSSDWDGSVQTIRIQAEDEAGNVEEILLDTTQQEHSWATSPIIKGIQGDHVKLKIHGTSSNSMVLDGSQGILEWDTDGWLWQAMSSTNEGEITIDSTDGLVYVSHISTPPIRFASCTITGEFDSVLTQCQILNGSDVFDYTMILLDDQGVMLDSFADRVEANQSSDLMNLSADDWSPAPGNRELTVRIVDSRGVQIYSTSKDFDVRRSDWNVGLTGIEAIGVGPSQKIRVTTIRDNQHLLSDADCSLSVEAGDYSATHRVDASAVYLLPTIDRPDVPDGEEIVIGFSCAFPWDIESDVSDNEVRMILQDGQIPENTLADWGTGVAAALLVIGVTIAGAWIVKNHRERRMMMEMTEAAIRQRFTKDSPPQRKEEENDPRFSDGVSQDSGAETVGDARSLGEGQSGQSQYEAQDQTRNQPEITETEDEDDGLDDFERRLKRLSRDK